MNRALFLTIAIAALVFAAQPAIGGDLKPSSTPQPVKPGDHIPKRTRPGSPTWSVPATTCWCARGWR